MGLRQPSTAPAALPEYDKLRKQTEQRANQQAQQQTEALNRRLASTGNLNSGAAFKQEQNLQNDVAQQREQAMGALDVQEAQELQRRNEVKETRDFAAQEAKLGRDFTAQEAAIGRKLQSDQFGQQMGQQDKQFDFQRDYQTDVFKEQKAQNKFMNALALDEKKMNEFMTKYNAALSMGTSGAQGAIKTAFEQLFPNDKFGVGNMRNLKIDYNDGANLASTFEIKPGAFGRKVWWNNNGHKQAQKFITEAKAGGYSDAAIQRALQIGGYT